MISKRFIKSSIIYTIAGALPMAGAILLLPFYLHYLPAEEFGALALYLSFSIIAQIVITFSFDASLYVFYHEFKKDNQKLSIFISSSFSLMLLIGLGVCAILWLTGSMLFALVFDGRSIDFFPYGFYSVITAVFQSVFKVNNSLLQSREKPELFLGANLLSFILVAVFTIGGLWMSPSTLLGPVGGRMLAFIISGLWALTLIYKEFGFHFDLKLLRSTFEYNTYQYIYQLQQWVINYFDRILMAAMITISDLGVYDFTIKCLLALDFVIAGMNNSFLPKILSRSADRNLVGSSVEINRYYHGLTGVIMLVVSGSILVLPAVIDWFVTKPGYAMAADLVPFASLVFLIRGMRYFFGLPYSTMKYSKPLPVIFMIVSVVKVGLSYLGIRYYGIYGAIGATLLAGSGEVILLWAWMRNRFAYSFNYKKLILGPLLLLVVILVSESMLRPANTWPLHIGYVVLTIGLLAWLYRKEVVLIDIRKIWNS